MGTERRRGWSAPGWGWPWTDGRKAGQVRRGSGRVAQLPARPPRARIVTRGHRQICHDQPWGRVGAPEQSCSYMRPQDQGPRPSCSPHTANRGLYVETLSPSQEPRPDSLEDCGAGQGEAGGGPGSCPRALAVRLGSRGHPLGCRPRQVDPAQTPQSPARGEDGCGQSCNHFPSPWGALGACGANHGQTGVWGLRGPWDQPVEQGNEGQ